MRLSGTAIKIDNSGMYLDGIKGVSLYIIRTRVSYPGNEWMMF